MRWVAAKRFAVLVFFASAATLIGVPSSASTVAFGTKPGSVTLDAGHPIAQILVSSLYARTTAFDVRVHRWSETASSDSVTSDDAPNLVVVPPIFSIAPYEEKVVRVALRRPPAITDVEQSYRVVMTEIEPAGSDAPRVLSVPLFVRPESRRGTVAYALRRTGSDEAALMVENHSNVHVYVGKLSISSDGKTVYEGKPAAYVLAGTTQALPLQLIAPLDGTVAELTFEGDDGSKQSTHAAVIP